MNSIAAALRLDDSKTQRQNIVQLFIRFFITNKKTANALKKITAKNPFHFYTLTSSIFRKLSCIVKNHFNKTYEKTV